MGSSTATTSRRTIRLATLEDAEADADRLVDADAAGQLRSSGNWTLGQALGHLSEWVQIGYRGMPMRVPWMVRLIGPMMRGRMIHGQMPAGVKLPGVEGGTFGTERLPTSTGRERLRDAYARLRTERPPERHPILGRMSHEDWIQLHLRHAELHLSFFQV